MLLPGCPGPGTEPPQAPLQALLPPPGSVSQAPTDTGGPAPRKGSVHVTHWLQGPDLWGVTQSPGAQGPLEPEGSASGSPCCPALREGDPATVSTASGRS